MIVRLDSRLGVLRHKIAPKCLLPGPFGYSSVGGNPGVEGTVHSYNLPFTYPYQAPLTRVCKVFSGRGMAGDLQVGLGFRPRLRQQPDPAPEPAPVQQPPQPVDAVADDADGPYRPAPRGAAAGSRRLPPGCRRPGPAASPPTTPASGGRSAPDRSFWSCPTSSPGF